MQSTTRPPVITATALPPQQSGVDRADPVAVAIAAMQVWFTWDTATDDGPNDAAARAAPLLTSSLAQAMTSNTPVGSPGADWMGWSAQHARLVATACRGAEPVPPPSATTAYTQLVVEQAVTLPDDVVTTTVQTIVDVKLTRGASGWEVASVQQR
ncbi:hypothetical protein [Nocardia sp. CY41]|uniref:hypothetical protein n=1 Tax=Nocardia sp. CY41 TaxID=2608686 RepID=UPI00135CD019|nr:hypothetical protein [Nocardia sp. CY41]